MSCRFLVVLALAAGIGTAAVAQDTTPIHFKPGAAGPSAGVIVQRGGRPWSGITIRDAAVGADRTRTRAFRGGRPAAIQVARSRARAAGIHVRRGHVPAPRPAIAARGARHDGVEIAAVADLEFGIDDHRHGRDLGRFGRDRDRFHVPQHRPRRDRFIAPRHRFGGKHEFRARGGGRRRENRRSRGRRLRCDTAIGSSVLAFC
jgi:hypothetical protein